jgi:DNA-directed RNA polymerase subunit RPC12/RpoP
MSPFDQDSRNRQRAHSSHDRAIYSDVSASNNGVPLRCQYCSHQSFRRSSLRAADFTQILLMRYPVRCLRCGQRQMVSFTVASISLSSSVKPRKSFEVPTSKYWSEPTGDSGSYPTAHPPAKDGNTEA